MRNPIEVDISRLGPLVKINEGDKGGMYRLHSFGVPGHRDLVFKRDFEQLAAVKSENLQKLVEYRTALPPLDRDRLDAAYTWPLCLVRDGSELVGHLMPLLGSEWFQVVEPSPGRMDEAPREAKWIVSPIAYAARCNVAVPPAGDPLRLAYCAKLAYALSLLHRHQICYGDLHWKNVIYTPGPAPQVKLVDCDSAKVDPTSALIQDDQDYWSPPEPKHMQSPASDCYKLALFILRCLDAHGPAHTRSAKRAAPYLDAAGMALLKAGLDKDPTRRPSAKQWYGYLRGYLNDLTSPPAIPQLSVSDSAVVVGTRIRVSWSVAGADTVTIETSDGYRASAPATGDSGAFEVSVARSGPVVLTATNSYGSNQAISEAVTVFEPPTLRLVEVPEPRLPGADLSTGLMMADVVRQAMQHMPDGAAVTLPELPDLATMEQRASALPTIEAADLHVAPLLDEVSRCLAALSREAVEIVRTMSIPSA